VPAPRVTPSVTSVPLMSSEATVAQVDPASTLTSRVSTVLDDVPARSAAERSASTLPAAVFVIQSVLLLPESELIVLIVTVVVGSDVSCHAFVEASLVGELPAASSTVAVTAIKASEIPEQSSSSL
jgi:hypothetical protein